MNDNVNEENVEKSSTIRRGPHKENPYTMLPIALIRDPSISPHAKATLFYYLSYPNCEFWLDKKQMKEIKELLDKGYAHIEHEREGETLISFWSKYE